MSRGNRTWCHLRHRLLRQPGGGDKVGPHPRRPSQEATITSDEAAGATGQYVDEFLPEGEHLEAARSRAHETGLAVVSPATGATLSWLCRLVGARTVAEIGSSAGVSGLWLLRGMAADGVLTTIDEDAESTRAARRAFADASVPTQRVRLIPGRPLDVLPRLADGGYDLVFVNGDAREYERCLDEALRLLRPDGLVVFAHALASGKVPDPAQRDAVTVAARGLVGLTREDPRIHALLLPVGDGLLLGQKRQPDPGPGPGENPEPPSATATTSNGS